MDEEASDQVIQGVMVRGAGGFALRVAGGALVPLELPRVPVDAVEKQVVLTGCYHQDGVFQVSRMIRI